MPKNKIVVHTRRPPSLLVQRSLAQLIQKEVRATLKDLINPSGLSTKDPSSDEKKICRCQDGSGFPGGVFSSGKNGGCFGMSRDMEITIDQMVASSLTRGRLTSGVLRALFGIVPNLIHR